MRKIFLQKGYIPTQNQTKSAGKAIPGGGVNDQRSGKNASKIQIEEERLEYGGKIGVSVAFLSAVKRDSAPLSIVDQIATAYKMEKNAQLELAVSNSISFRLEPQSSAARNRRVTRA
jgi:arginyl-tRNA synthetase